MVSTATRGLKVLVLPLLMLSAWLVFDRTSTETEVAQDYKVRPLEILHTEPTPAPRVTPWATPVTRKPGPKVAVDGVCLGATKAEAKRALSCFKPAGKPTWEDDEPGTLGYASDGCVTEYRDGRRLKLMINGKTVSVGDKRERLIKLLGEPDKRLPGMMGCGTDPLDYWYYRVDGGVLSVISFDQEGWEEEIPVRARGRIAEFSLHVN